MLKEARSDSVETVALPAKPGTRRGHVAVAACALVLLAILCGVKLVHSERRLGSKPPIVARVAEPLPQALPDATPEPAELATPTAPREPSRRAAKERSKAPHGESDWLIRRQ